jgi:hypothetical protein
LYCYLFKSKGGVDSFVGEGFSNWKKERKDLIFILESLIVITMHLG